MTIAPQPAVRDEAAFTEWVRLASPAPARPMSSMVEALALPIREAVVRVAGAVANPDAYLTAFAPRRTGLGFSLGRDSFEMRAARAVVAEWLTGYALGALAVDASLRDAEDWFFGDVPIPRMVADDRGPFDDAPSPETVFALLPYVLDALRPGTRREVLRDAGAAPDRRARKQRGAFYTPADVAERMLSVVSLGSDDTCFDPTCGTGVFLRHAVMSGAASADVFGCDIDASVADAAAFVVLAAALRRGEEWPSPWAGWQAVRSNIATLDALQLRASQHGSAAIRAADLERVRAELADGSVPAAVVDSGASTRLSDVFPQLSTGADILLSNPPYAPIGAAGAAALAGSDFESLADGVPSSTTRAEVLLVENLWRLTKAETGRGSLVLPLSVATSSKREFASLRRAMQMQAGGWTLSFFDRAPDALFGDDVKTRNLIATYDAAADRGMATTRLLRWTSRTRSQFLQTLTPTPVVCDISEHVPKIGGGEEARLYEAVRRLDGRFGDDVLRIRQAVPHSVTGSPTCVYVAPTAYNWIGVVRDVAALTSGGHTSENALLELTLADEELADAAYALLSSRYVFWLWRVESDGFHVTRRLLEQLPFCLGRVPEAVPELAVRGRLLWTAALGGAIRSVNKGRTTVSFPTLAAAVLDDLDSVVVDAFGLAEAAAGCDVRRWHDNLVVVDFSDERRLRSQPLQRGIRA